MKRFVVGLGTIGVLLAASGAMAQGRGAAPACTTVACDLQADWGGNTNGLIGIANAMPDNEYGFKPTPAQESFAERLMHVVNIDIKLLSTLGGKTPAPMVNAKASSKADVLAAMKEWSAYGAAVLKEFNDQQLSERVTSMPFMGPTASRIRVSYFAIGHGQDIYGQLAVYLRLKGVTPPRSNRP
jgi:uncharacterized damage-inducible protein DinB